MFIVFDLLFVWGLLFCVDVCLFVNLFVVVFLVCSVVFGCVRGCKCLFCSCVGVL